MSAAGPRIRRAFVALDDAEIHYRHAGTRADGPADGAVGSDGRPLPLVLVHASPASSLGLVPLIRAFATDRHVVAPDTVGNGDSTGEIPDGAPIAWFAQRLADALERIGLARYDLYGTHTGASLATELALRHPGRVGALVLDGVGLYPPDFQRELLERYAPEIRPDPHGGHVAWAWHFVRDTYLFWPWYRLDREHRRGIGLPSPEVLHAKVVEVLKAVRTYHHSYRAAMAYDKRARIPELAVRTLAACARDDMLSRYFDELASLVPGGQAAWLDGIATPEAAARTADRLRAFFDAR